MSKEKLHVDGSHGSGEISGHNRPTSVDQQVSTATSEASGSYGSETHIVGCGSHPGLLTLARILGRNAARADLRRARRGSMPIMAINEALLVLTAVIAGLLVWSIVQGLR